MQRLTQEGELLRNKGGDIVGQSRRFDTGIAVSEGIALAKAYKYHSDEIAIRTKKAPLQACDEQLALFHDILNRTKVQLANLYEEFKGKDEEKANLFQAYAQLLEDETIDAEIYSAIRENHLFAEAAVEQVYNKYVTLFATSENKLLEERVADLEDLKQRLIYGILGIKRTDLSNLSENVIVIAGELMPSEAITMDREHVKGVITQKGGYNSHSAIMLRSMAIPAIFGVSNEMESVIDGEEVILNAAEGYVVLSPSEQEKKRFTELQTELQIQKISREAFRLMPCILEDGSKVEIGINVDGPEYDNTKGLFDFVGLLRTEFVFMSRSCLPSEEEQFAIYRDVVQRAGGRRVTLRTLDVGEDKRLPYEVSPLQAKNDSMERGLRFCFANTDLFFCQLRAALRASAFGPLQIMFPIVESLEDIAKAKEYVEEAKRQLRERHIAFDESIPVGIMIEVPGIARMADKVASLVDFASVGTNDLSQYLGISRRDSMTVTQYNQSDSDEMRQILGFVIASFAEAGKSLSICGEMAGNPKLAKELTLLGARQLSMNETAIAAVKEALIKK